MKTNQSIFKVFQHNDEYFGNAKRFRVIKEVCHKTVAVHPSFHFYLWYCYGKLQWISAEYGYRH